MAYRLHAEHGARAAPRMHCVYACWTTGRAPLKNGDIVNIRASVVRTAWRDIPGNTESPLHGGPVRWLHNRGGRRTPPPAMPIRPRSETISRLQSARHGQHHAQRPAGTTHLSTVAAESQAHGKATRRVPLVISPPRSARRGVGSAAAKSQTRIRVRFCCSRFAVIATVQTRLTNSSAFDHARRAVPPSAAHAHAPHPCAITPVPPNASSATAVARPKPLLSGNQKRVNHILSEQKRRNAIRDGYMQLTTLLAPAGAPPGTGMPTRGRPKGSGGRGRGSKGKSGILFKAREYIRFLEEGRDALVQEVVKVEGAAGIRHP
ncbi:predicted protein [Postia placenta Mad-698-R]|nr:predicted protein [Postia placenta Mad-698-R]